MENAFTIGVEYKVVAFELDARWKSNGSSLANFSFASNEVGSVEWCSNKVMRFCFQDNGTMGVWFSFGCCHRRLRIEFRAKLEYTAYCGLTAFTAGAHVQLYTLIREFKSFVIDIVVKTMGVWVFLRRMLCTLSQYTSLPSGVRKCDSSAIKKCCLHVP